MAAIGNPKYDKMLKIIFIIAYFGKFRADFAFWLKSVEHNPDVDFLLFTDQTLIKVPKNVTVVKTSLQEIQQLAQKNIWEGCRIEHPYKMCDYKTAYGDLFCDYIKDYDFWGHCDVDLVFGNIRHYITNDILENYDRIGLEGFFTLYRNTPDINRHYWNLGEEFIKHSFSDQGIFGLDEWGPGGKGGGTSNWWLENKRKKLWCDMVFDSLEPYYYDFITKRADRDNVKNVIFCYNNGKLTRYGLQNGKVIATETLLAHIQKRMVKVKTLPTERFSIIPQGDYVDYIYNITPCLLHYIEYKGRIITFFNKIRNKIKKTAHL